MEKHMLVELDPPKIRQHEAFKVAGLSLQCSRTDIAGIPAHWQAFGARIGEITEAEPQSPGYGVCYDGTADGQFKYVAGMAASAAPAGMTLLDIAAQKYAVFTHCGHISEFPKTAYTIWNKALCNQGLKPAPAPDFELYDDRFDAMTGHGEVEYWIPIT